MRICTRWTPGRVGALIIIVGCAALLISGIDLEVKAILAASGAWLIWSIVQRQRQLRKEEVDK